MGSWVAEMLSGLAATVWEPEPLLTARLGRR
jgi:hypothetical protein